MLTPLRELCEHLNYISLSSANVRKSVTTQEWVHPFNGIKIKFLENPSFKSEISDTTENSISKVLY